MNKFSKFTQIIELGGRHFLFNIANEQVMVLVSELLDIVLQNKSNIDNIQTIHPDLYRQMDILGMIVPEDCDEAQELIDSWEAEDNDPEKFNITINPTLDCNLRCWYCYEKHDESARMDNQTLDAIYELIKDKVCKQRVKYLTVSFFGGEPLLSYKDVVYPILKFSADLCHKYNVAIYSGFTTNGVLLTSKIIKELNSLDLTTPVTFQITIDGNRYFHNQTRVSERKAPTYDTIIKNVLLAISHTNRVYMRFNYTEANIHSFIDVMEEFAHLSVEERKYLSFSFQQVWQTIQTERMIKDEAIKIAKLYKDNGFNAISDTEYSRHHCYADFCNRVVVNYNGDVFKCTARDFTRERREGVLCANGTIEWNERFEKRMEIKYKSLLCRKCSILPLCNGGCSQKKIEKGNVNECYKNLKAKDKLDIVKGKLCEILSI